MTASLARATRLRAQRELLHGARRRIWHENLWSVEAADSSVAMPPDVASDRLWRMLGAVVGDSPLHSYCGVVPTWNAERGGVWLQGDKSVPRGTLIASWPGVSYLPTDVLTILHCGQQHFPDVAWLWRRQLAAQQAHLQRQSNVNVAPEVDSSTRSDSLITRADGVVFDASRCDAVARFVNPFAVAHRIRVAPTGVNGNVVPVSLNVELVSASERLLPFIGNVPCPFGAEDILSPSDNLLNTAEDKSRDPFLPLLLFVTTADLAPDAELLQSAVDHEPHQRV